MNFFHQETLSPEETRDETKLQNPSTLELFAANYTTDIGLTPEAWVDILGSAWPAATAKIEKGTPINVREPKYFAKLRTAALAANADRAG